MRHNLIIFSFLLIYFKPGRLLHHHVPEQDFKNTDSSRKVLNLTLDELIL